MSSLTPGVVRDLIARHQFHVKKSLGQNFLVDGNIMAKIMATAGLGSEDVVVEIGPGLGSLTREMALKCRRVIAVEIDRNLFPILQETLAQYDNVTLVEADALKTDFNRLVAEELPSHRDPYKVVANLPYYITTPLIMHLLENRFHISQMVVMVQEEVARRLAARPGTRDYGAITVTAGYYARVEVAFFVPRTVFIPRPGVDSAIVSMIIRDQPAVSVLQEEHFFSLVRAAFQQRRKTLLNALTGVNKQLTKSQWVGLLQGVDIDPSRRGETLTLQEFARLANAFTKLEQTKP